MHRWRNLPSIRENVYQHNLEDLAYIGFVNVRKGSAFVPSVKLRTISFEASSMVDDFSISLSKAPDKSVDLGFQAIGG